MTRIRRFRPTPALAVAMIALFVALSGTGVAAVQQLRRNSVTTIHVKDRSLLARDFRAGQLPRGPVGPVGPAGPAGPAGPSGSANIRWAVFRQDGGIAAQSGGIALAAKPSAGQYIVNFGSATDGRLVIVSGSLAAGDTLDHGGIAASPCGTSAEAVACASSFNTSSHVAVHAWNSAGAFDDTSFYIAVVG